MRGSASIISSTTRASAFPGEARRRLILTARTGIFSSTPFGAPGSADRVNTELANLNSPSEEPAHGSYPYLDQDPPRHLHRQQPRRRWRPGHRRWRDQRTAQGRSTTGPPLRPELRCPRARGAAGADQHPPPLLPDPHPRLGSGGQPATVSLAADPLSGMGTPDPLEARPG